MGLHQWNLMNKGVPLPEINIADIFDDYAENITFRARIALTSRRPYPRTQAEIKIFVAYLDGLTFAHNLPLEALFPFAIGTGTAVLKEMRRNPQILIDAGCLSAWDYMLALYRDEAGKLNQTSKLPELWKRAPDIAEIISMWQALNDVCQFLAVISRFGKYKDDYRRMYSAVKGSLSHYGLLEERKARRQLVYEDFTPPPRSTRLPICLPI
jgi:hypothetical protein